MKSIKFSQAREMYEAMPPQKMLWGNVVENSFGLVFGPSKSGKTIFCENLAMSIALGRENYLGYPLEGVPKKVLFISLEECFRNRVNRNILQFNTLNENEQALIDENYSVQDKDSLQFIVTKENWNSLHEFISTDGADVVFIDSITRMNHGKLEDGKTAEEIMSRLRNIAHELNITLFAIHHTPKLNGGQINMDSIKGSTVFAQESDFAIGINRTDRKHRYMKNVFFRYENDDDEFVKEFSIDESAWLNLTGEAVEDEILQRTDRRRANNKDQQVVEFFNSKPGIKYSYSEAVDALSDKLGLKERQVKTYLSKLSISNKIYSNNGFYNSVNYEVSKEERFNG